MNNGIIWKSTSGTYINTVENQPTEFSIASYFLYSSGEEKRTEFNIVKSSYSAGLRLEIKKYGEKRTSSQTIEIGKDQTELLIEFLKGQVHSLKNYASDKIETSNL